MKALKKIYGLQGLKQHLILPGGKVACADWGGPYS